MGFQISVPFKVTKKAEEQYDRKDGELEMLESNAKQIKEENIMGLVSMKNSAVGVNGQFWRFTIIPTGQEKQYYYSYFDAEKGKIPQIGEVWSMILEVQPKETGGYYRKIKQFTNKIEGKIPETIMNHINTLPSLRLEALNIAISVATMNKAPANRDQIVEDAEHFLSWILRGKKISKIT